MNLRLPKLTLSRLAHLFLSKLLCAACALILLGQARVAMGQALDTPPAPSLSSADEPGAELTIYLMTMGPGSQVWEKFGHDAIWVRDRRTRTDWVYNYGMFDFNQANFYRNFIMGTMRYWMAGGMDAATTVAMYAEDHRSVWVQELNLTPRQRADLRDFLIWNEQPKHRFYHYDYYRDNCATRVRDALDAVLDGQIRAQTDTEASGTTYRIETRRAMAGDPFLYTALEFLLGQPVDRPLTAWQEMFLPLRLRDHLMNVRVRDAQGNLVPLVKQETTLYDGGDGGVPAHPPRWWPWYGLIGILSGVIFVWLGGRSIRCRGCRWMFGMLGVAWSMLLGFAGLFLLWGEVYTSHVAIDHNENILHFSPLAAGLIVLLPLLLRGGRRTSAAALCLAFALVICGVGGLALKALPAFDQHNWDMIAWTLPANIGLAWGIWRFTRGANMTKEVAAAPDVNASMPSSVKPAT